MVGDKRVAILDMDSIAFAMGWGNKIPDGNGDYLRDDKGRLIYEDKTEDQLIISIDETMKSILESCNCTHYIGFIKGKNTGNHRYKAKSDYKSNRPPESPKWWYFVKGYLESVYNVYPVNNIEVDDAVNITRLNIKDSFIVAIDKDLLHLEGTHYNWRTGEFKTVTSEEAETYFWEDMIVGQPGDGVSGIPGKGKAYASKIHCTSLSVFAEYEYHFGEQKGIEEFYKNYTCLKILDSYEGFKIPDILEFNKKSDSGEGIDELWQWQTD